MWRCEFSGSFSVTIPSSRVSQQRVDTVFKRCLFVICSINDSVEWSSTLCQFWRLWRSHGSNE